MRSVSLLTLLGASLFAFAQTKPQAMSGNQPIEVHIVGDPKGSPWTAPETLLGALGIVGGIGGMLIQRYWQRQDERAARITAERDRLQFHVLESLKWFAGKTQKRSIGISVIEGNIDQFPKLRPTWSALLTNQAVYLLTESHQKDAAHEISNLDRIMMLLLKSGISDEQRLALIDAIMLNREGKGLRLDSKKLETWESKLVAGRALV